MFRRMLEYKQAWRGGEVIAVNPRYTSQECPGVPPRLESESSPTSLVLLCGVWLYVPRRYGCGEEYPRPGAQGEVKRLLAPLGATGITVL